MTRCVIYIMTQCVMLSIPVRVVLGRNGWKGHRVTHIEVCPMSVFKDCRQLYDTVGVLMDRAKSDPSVGGKIAKSGIIIQFRYTEPDAMTTIDAKDKPTQPDA